MAWEQIGTAITFYAFYVASKTGKTGLTPTVDVFRVGSLIVTAGNASEVGDGLYSYTLASGSVTVEGEYTAVFKTADASVDAQHIPALWIVGRDGDEHIDAAITSRLATASYTTPPTVGQIADQVWDEAIAGHLNPGSTGLMLNGAGAAGDPWLAALPGPYVLGQAGYMLTQILGCTCGSGSVAFSYATTDSITGLPVAGVFVWVTSDLAGLAVVAQAYSDAFGNVVFMLNPGTYYFWRQKAGYTATNPDTEVVT